MMNTLARQPSPSKKALLMRITEYDLCTILFHQTSSRIFSESSEVFMTTTDSQTVSTHLSELGDL